MLVIGMVEEKKEKKCGRQSTGAERSSSIDIDNNCFI